MLSVHLDQRIRNKNPKKYIYLCNIYKKYKNQNGLKER